MLTTRAKKILVERVLSEPCQATLIKRLESPNVVIRTDSLFILKYIFEFKYKTRSTTSVEILLTADFAQDNKGMLQVLSFALSHSESILLALSRSIDSPEATKLAIQNLTFLMRVHRQFRLRYARNQLFIEWRQNPQNPLYSLSTVEGLLLVHDEPDRDDIFLSEVQQFIYYIGERNWPLVTGSLEETQLPPKVVDRFRQIWDTKSADKPPVLPFPDPGERWFSDQESERSDGEDNEDESDYVSYEEFLMSVNNLNEEEDRQSVDFLEEPDPVTPEDLLAYFQAAEEAGLRSQDRRRGRRREQEGGQESAGTDGTAQPLREI